MPQGTKNEIVDRPADSVFSSGCVFSIESQYLDCLF